MLLGLALTVLLAALAIFQLALALGAPIGRFAWGGQHRVLPARLRIGSVVAILIYALIALIAWDRTGAIDVFPELFSIVAMWVVFAYFALGIFLNAISRSKPERYVMVPASTIVLTVLSFFRGGRDSADAEPGPVGQHDRAVGGDRDGVLGVSAARSVGAAQRPPVRIGDQLVGGLAGTTARGRPRGRRAADSRARPCRRWARAGRRA